MHGVFCGARCGGVRFSVKGTSANASASHQAGIAIRPMIATIGRVAVALSADTEFRRPSEFTHHNYESLFHQSALIEIFEVLQRLRLRYQFAQLDAGEKPTDSVSIDRLSPIDRSVISQAVREIAAVQRRAANLSASAPTDAWLEPPR